MSNSNRPYWWTFILIGVGMFVYTIDRTGFPVGIAAMGKEFHFTVLEAATLGTVFLLGQAIIDIPAGYWLDRFDRKKTVIVGLVGLGFFTMVVTLARGFWSATVARVLFGIFEGIYNIAQFAIVGSILPENRALVNGMTQVFYGAGTFAGQGFVGDWLQGHPGGWQAPLLWLGAAAMIFGLAGIFLFKRPFLRRYEVANEMSQGGFWTTLGRALRNGRVWKAILILAAGVVPNWVLLGVGPYIFIHFRHYSPAFVGLVFGLGFGIGTLFIPLATYWADRFGRRPVVVGLGLWMSVMLALMFYVAPANWIMIALSAAAEVGIGGLYAMGYTLSQDAIASSSMVGIGIATGIAGGFGYLFAFLSGPLTGVLVGLVGHLWAMNITSILPGLVAAAVGIGFWKNEIRPTRELLAQAAASAPASAS